MLPVIAVFLLIAVNRRDLMGRYRNGLVGNVAGCAVVLVAMVLGGWQLLRISGWSG